jgi:hypothetical protein
MERADSGAAGRSPVRTVVLIWLGWAVLMLGFQAFVTARLDLVRPDRTLPWTASWTNADASARHPYLKTPILKEHSAWDSEFYISIALHGYEDPAMRAASPDSTPEAEVAGAKRDHKTWVSLNHAFLPGYPFAMGLIARPLAAVGVNPAGAATFAGVVISLAAALGGMLAIADLARNLGEEGDGTRAAFYLAVFPSAAFLAQVYTESLFLALSFGALACVKRDRWGWAAALAVAATFTRATGFLLVIPFAWAWWSARDRRTLGRAILAASPMIAYLVWRLFFGNDFDFVETRYFGRFPLAIGRSWDAWMEALGRLTGGDARASSYELVELAGVVASLWASALMWRRDKALALYGLAIFALVATSGAALGMHRYALALPALFLVPASLGQDVVFDRVWTLASVLGLAVLTLSFSFGFWAG